MKKILLPMMVLSLMLAGCAAKSCQAAIMNKWVRGSGNVVEERRTVNDFSKVHLSGFGNLKIELGNEEGLRIKAEDNLIPHLETYVRDATLIIEIEDNVHLDPTEPIYYYLTAKELHAISVSGSGSVEAPELEAEEFSVDLSGSTKAYIEGVVSDSAGVDISGSAEVRIDSLKAQLLEVDISGSGDVAIGSGKVHRQEIGVSGSATYESAGLESAEAVTDLSGTASVALRVKDRLEADINGAASVKYIGNPKVDAEVSGVGRIRQIEE